MTKAPNNKHTYTFDTDGSGGVKVDVSGGSSDGWRNLCEIAVWQCPTSLIAVKCCVIEATWRREVCGTFTSSNITFLCNCMCVCVEGVCCAPLAMYTLWLWWLNIGGHWQHSVLTGQIFVRFLLSSYYFCFYHICQGFVYHYWCCAAHLHTFTHTHTHTRAHFLMSTSWMEISPQNTNALENSFFHTIGN